MRTLQLMAGAPAGGAELFYERLCIALHGAGGEVLPVIRTDAARAGRLAAAGLAPVQRGFLLPLLTRVDLGRLARRARPAAIVAWMGRAAAAAPAGPWALVGRLGGYYDLRRFARCQHLIGNTPHIVDWMRSEGWPAARTHHVPNFVPDMAAVPAASRGAFGIPAGVPLLLGLGRLHPAKGFDTLVAALGHLPEAHLLIAGAGPERPALLAQAAGLGVARRLHLPGWQDCPGALLAMADVFVCSSRAEPLGNMVLEAWSACRPVVATATVGPAALVRDGRDGLLVPPEDAAALAQAIGTLLAEPGAARMMAAAGRARYCAAYTPQVVVPQWQHFLAGVAR